MSATDNEKGKDNNNDTDLWKSLVCAHFMKGQLDLSVATAYMEEYKIDLETLIAGCMEEVILKAPSQTKEMLQLHTTFRKEIKNEKKRVKADQKELRKFLGKHVLVVPAQEMRHATVKESDDLRNKPDVYNKYKDAFDCIQYVRKWEDLALKYEPLRKSCVQCSSCRIRYANISAIYDDVDPTFFSTQCYHCASKILDCAKRVAIREIKKDNTETIRGMLKVIQDTVENEQTPSTEEASNKRRKVSPESGEEEE